MVKKLEKGLSVALNAKIIGSGDEIIVLAHGFGTDQSIWDKIVPHLTQRYRVLLFDWSFSGAIKDQSLFDPVKYSSYEAFTKDLIDLLDELKLKTAVFIGHSMAGMIGCKASVERPELFKRLVLIGASPRYLNSEDYEGGFKSSDLDEIFSNIESNYLNWVSAFAPVAMGSNDPISARKFENCLKRMRADVRLAMAKIVFLSDERDVLDKVEVPCTIVQTKNDIVVPISVVDYMQKKIKGKSRVEIIETDGHFPQLTAPLQLIDVLGRALGF